MPRTNCYVFSPVTSNHPTPRSRQPMATWPASGNVSCNLAISSSNTDRSPGGGGVFPYMGYIGMCGPKGYGFSAVSVMNRVSILADFGYFSHK